ncbi:MAG: inorganic phosphate transporter [Gemmatimonadetes bacterium]|jgi:PiT family inorganic phosphate transporter|nr:inorganic phosphate transporter [Gemmatimonadota bacterium]MBK9547910.1 inorganic phosphate transporter [Gemmatimonadota bacterium]MBP6442825.1 inorganic phosphate transporter [Gemmatimonadales bacterium]MBP6571114.1 inorganic phosphate transporter [Gemmatimonadales bacterium]
MDQSIAFVLVVVVVALIFDFINGFHDSANSIATVVATRVLTPGVAVFWAASFNFLAAFIVGTAVAKTISKGLIDPSIVTPTLLCAALLGAIVWNLLTWWLGLPSSSSHALLGGFAGAALAKAGPSSIILAGWIKPIVGIVLSPLLGMTLGLLLSVTFSWALWKRDARTLDRFFRRAQLVSAGFYSLAHGSNDAQKTMGIIVGLLVASQSLFVGETGLLHHFYLPTADHVPLWVEMAAYSAIAAGTAMGGWRIVKTMGSGITKLQPFGGFCAETGGAITVLLASSLGVPVSTTHTITGAIVGVGASKRLAAVRWGVAGRIVWAWVLTIPCSALVAAIVFWVIG